MNLADIDTSVPFCLFADCTVLYDGRASSTLERGRYLIVKKTDGSYLIHGSDKCPPRNYQGPNSKLTIDGDRLICTNRKEVIIVTVYDIINYHELINWSSAKIKISKTEKELVDKIQNNWASYFPDKTHLELHREFKTAVGDIDLLGVSINCYLAIEAKRKKITLKDCTQLRRYIEHLQEGMPGTIDGWLAAPSIGKKALQYLKKHNLHWLQIDFD
jgi:RecB family endonuclease NucS